MAGVLAYAKVHVSHEETFSPLGSASLHAYCVGSSSSPLTEVSTVVFAK